MTTITADELRAVVTDPVYAGLIDEIVELGERVDRLEQAQQAPALVPLRPVYVAVELESGSWLVQTTAGVHYATLRPAPSTELVALRETNLLNREIHNL